MNTVVKITVASFDTFIDGIQSSQALRDKYGVKIVAIYRTRSTPNELIIISEYKDETSANEYLQSDELEAAMKVSGIISEPEMWKVDPV